ncbi:hypothetical protein LCGC14_2173490 [marine sediment metagenome]|uniref:Uncharacterized protein n=1 Tax=marine sediment metagenome TaxID=412755 RepID=A0A0F9GK65_9ZZZZ
MGGNKAIIPATSVDTFTFLGFAIPPELVVLKVRKDIIAARKYFQFAQVDTAKMLRLSESTIEQFEQERISNPTTETLQKYIAFIALSKLYKEAFGNKKYMVKTFLGSPSISYGRMSAIEYAASKENGIFHVLGIERRKHA